MERDMLKKKELEDLIQR